ncbi:MAG: tRNA (N(6)-L-threonylcarbamoyladenosine(37)-C(2))-methylthiotransferase MtaB [Acidobacteriota bacterium]
MPKKLYLATFGCRTNQADSAAIRDSLFNEGFEETERCEEADIIVVNSCTVTQRSDQQVRQLSRKLRRENPGARLLVTGCYAQRDPDALSRIAGIDAVIGNTHRSQIPQIIKELQPQASVSTAHSEIAAIYRDDFARVRAIGESPAVQLGGRTRPFVKIQDGCDAKCSYCIIPSVRGPSRSVPPELVLGQVRDLALRGFKEIVLTGIHIGTYGFHLQPRYLLDRLLAEIVELPGLVQVRISSLEPMELSRKVIELASRTNKIAPHFHICLQSGSDRILKAMRRPYKTARFASIVETIRERIPHAGIGTDVIVGFPGETEEDHRQTVDFVEKMPFTYLHCFPYSDRPGTASSTMPGHVAPDQIRRRSAALRMISSNKNRRFRRGFLGRRLRVLTLADQAGGKRLALSGNYLRVRLPLDTPPNLMLEVEITGEAGEDLVGLPPK